MFAFRATFFVSSCFVPQGAARCLTSPRLRAELLSGAFSRRQLSTSGGRPFDFAILFGFRVIFHPSCCPWHAYACGRAPMRQCNVRKKPAKPPLVTFASCRLLLPHSSISPISSDKR